MLFELSMVPLGTGPHTSNEIAEALKIIDASGLSYQLTPSSTNIEGDWDEVMPLIQQCHRRMRQFSEHVVTTIKIEDKKGEREQLSRNVASVEEKVGHSLDKDRGNLKMAKEFSRLTK